MRMTTHTDCNTALQVRFGYDDERMLEALYGWLVHEIEVVNELVTDDPAKAETLTQALNEVAKWVAPPYTPHWGTD